MNSLHNVAVLVAVVALLGSIGIGAALQQAFAQGIIVEYKEQFDKLSEQFQQDVLGLVSGDPPTEADPPTEDRAVDPPDPDKLAALFDNYKQETFRIFGADPPSESAGDPPTESAGDPPTEADPPSESDPPTEVDPPEPDLER